MTARASIGLFGEERRSKSKTVREWFVFINFDVKRVGVGDEALDLATKAVRSLESMKDIPTGKSRRAQHMRSVMLEVAVEATRAQEFLRRLRPKQRAKLDAAFDKLDAAFATFDKRSAIFDVSVRRRRRLAKAPCT